MKFATWKLDFSNSNYGTGPEEKLLDLGISAEACLADGEVGNGATVMGYVSNEADEALLSLWSFKNISQDQALNFAQSIDANAIFVDGRIELSKEDE